MVYKRCMNDDEELLPRQKEKLDTALAELADLKNQVKRLTDKLEAMEEMVKESNEILVAFSQSYYWTPQWQAMEAQAEGASSAWRVDSKQYDDVEDLLSGK